MPYVKDNHILNKSEQAMVFYERLIKTYQSRCEKWLSAWFDNEKYPINENFWSSDNFLAIKGLLNTLRLWEKLKRQLGTENHNQARILKDYLDIQQESIYTILFILGRGRDLCLRGDVNMTHKRGVMCALRDIDALEKQLLVFEEKQKKCRISELFDCCENKFYIALLAVGKNYNTFYPQMIENSMSVQQACTFIETAIQEQLSKVMDKDIKDFQYNANRLSLEYKDLIVSDIKSANEQIIKELDKKVEPMSREQYIDIMFATKYHPKITKNNCKLLRLPNKYMMFKNFMPYFFGSTKTRIKRRGGLTILKPVVKQKTKKKIVVNQFLAKVRRELELTEPNNDDY